MTDNSPSVIVPEESPCPRGPIYKSLSLDHKSLTTTLKLSKLYSNSSQHRQHSDKHQSNGYKECKDTLTSTTLCLKLMSHSLESQHTFLMSVTTLLYWTPCLNDNVNDSDQVYTHSIPTETHMSQCF